MIKSITLTNFKKYDLKTISLKDGVTLLVGGNNEGKSSLLHALAVWEFCKNYILHSKGKESLCVGNKRQGVGLSIDDFSPVNIPELKYLWTNLKPRSSYSLKIRCDWDTDDQQNLYLEIGLALANDRLFLKTTDTNLNIGSKLPKIAYLPPFAGIVDRESRYYPAERNHLIGQGLAGGVLRNTIIDMHMRNQAERLRLKSDKSKIKNSDLKVFRETDSFEQLNSVLTEIFNCQLVPAHFDVSFHNYVKVEMLKGLMVGRRFKSFPDYKKRDIMTEGSGFLQWLSVYTFALDPEIDVLLLDEPDAHLHCSLQTILMSRLIQIAQNNNKQILVATHSVEIVKGVPVHYIMDINGRRCEYLANAASRTRLLAGLGTEYSPILNEAQKTKNILFVENESDVVILKHLAKALNLSWPENLTVWPNSYPHTERNHIMLFMKDQISGIQSISLSDLDNGDYSHTLSSLLDKGYTSDEKHPHIRYRKWRRCEIENYLLSKSVMARVGNCDEKEVDNFFVSKSIAYPSVDKFRQSDIDDSTTSMFVLAGKELIEAFCAGKKFNKFTIAQQMRADEVCDDVRTLISEIVAMCSEDAK